MAGSCGRHFEFVVQQEGPLLPRKISSRAHFSLRFWIPWLHQLSAMLEAKYLRSSEAGKKLILRRKFRRTLPKRNASVFLLCQTINNDSQRRGYKNFSKNNISHANNNYKNLTFIFWNFKGFWINHAQILRTFVSLFSRRSWCCVGPTRWSCLGQDSFSVYGKTILACVWVRPLGGNWVHMWIA